MCACVCVCKRVVFLNAAFNSPVCAAVCVHSWVRQVLPGAGHNLMAEAAQLVNALMNKFLMKKCDMPFLTCVQVYVCMCMYVCMCVCMYVCMHVCMCVCVCTLPGLPSHVLSGSISTSCFAALKQMMTLRATKASRNGRSRTMQSGRCGPWSCVSGTTD